jgi:hypothetical protein
MLSAPYRALFDDAVLLCREARLARDVGQAKAEHAADIVLRTAKLLALVAASEAADLVSQASDLIS